MSLSPLEHSASLRIGTVEYVSPDEIKVQLDLEAPDGIAANAGIPRSFPRINSYVLISTENGYIVGQIEWIAVERSPFPKRKGFQDYGLLDLPFPLRKMRVNPLGLLKTGKADQFEFQRGVQSFPSVGEPVLIPTDKQLKAIVESGKKRRVKIGTSPLAANADVKVDPDRLFGRHLAVLGNTGSGKSCSVAGLIQWSLEEARNNRSDNPNARFIVLDPNGEYSKVFKDSGRVYQVDVSDKPLKVPLWFWNSAEWCSFTQASSRAQVPLLKRALRSMRNEEFEISTDETINAKKFLGIILQSTIASKNTGEPYKQFPHNRNFTERLLIWKTSIEQYDATIEADISAVATSLETAVNAHKTVQSNGFTNYAEYTSAEIDSIINIIRENFTALGGTETGLLPKNEDTPIKFSGEVFVNFLELLSQQSGNEQYVEFLLARIRTMFADTRMNSIIGDNEDVALDKWLEDYIGKNEAENGSVTVIDLSLVPAEIIHVIIAVISRVVFESLQRYRKLEGKTLPTVLVMEEAHTFIKRYKEDAENQNASSICCQVFEKIAREGRKFGLGLVMSSQRPSELSSTVLSQCNSFLLHRISNDRDQELVNRLVPDNLRGLLRELPSLPSQNAILLGWASELPVMVRMNDLPESKRPHSEDPDYWDVWTGKDEDGNEVQRGVNWKKITDDWQQTNIPPQNDTNDK
ncbi:MAG: DUF87 domain-containing protein [Candidatus Omnitrophica bacterium]|nr:DUF87 domain-containing protein [Candidatus Omnitrophota bacterium]